MSVIANLDALFEIHFTFKLQLIHLIPKESLFNLLLNFVKFVEISKKDKDNQLTVMPLNSAGSRNEVVF